jgi:hypothetical protein
MRFIELIVLMFAVMFCLSSGFKVGNVVKKVSSTVGKVVSEAPELAACASQAAPYMAPLGACIAIPNPVSCVQGVQGAEQFLGKCCSIFRSSGSNPVANQLKGLCQKLPL